MSHATTVLCVTLLSIALAAGGAAEVVRPGVQYAGETTLEFPEYGVSLILPSGWIGGLPPESAFLIMQSEALGAYVFAGIDEMTVPGARAVMQAPIDLGDGILLQPKGEVQIADSILTADYTVSGAQTTLSGLVTTIVGSDGWGISFIAASAPEQLEKLRAVVDGMHTSLAPIAPPDPSDPGSSPWIAELNGYKLTHFFTRSGYTEEDYIWLCPDFRFYHSFNSGGFGGGASGAFASKNGGRWGASGSLDGGTLTLSYNDGSVANYGLTHEGTKLFLDGKRYFREETGCD